MEENSPAVAKRNASRKYKIAFFVTLAVAVLLIAGTLYLFATYNLKSKNLVENTAPAQQNELELEADQVETEDLQAVAIEPKILDEDYYTVLLPAGWTKNSGKIGSCAKWNYVNDGYCFNKSVVYTKDDVSINVYNYVYEDYAPRDVLYGSLNKNSDLSTITAEKIKQAISKAPACDVQLYTKGGCDKLKGSFSMLILTEDPKDKVFIQVSDPKNDKLKNVEEVASLISSIKVKE